MSTMVGYAPLHHLPLPHSPTPASRRSPHPCAPSGANLTRARLANHPMNHVTANANGRPSSVVQPTNVPGLLSLSRPKEKRANSANGSKLGPKTKTFCEQRCLDPSKSSSPSHSSSVRPSKVVTAPVPSSTNPIVASSASNNSRSNSRRSKPSRTNSSSDVVNTSAVSSIHDISTVFALPLVPSPPSNSLTIPTDDLQRTPSSSSKSRRSRTKSDRNFSATSQPQTIPVPRKTSHPSSLSQSPSNDHKDEEHLSHSAPSESSFMLPPQPQLLLTGGGGRRTKSRPGKSRKREGRGPSDEVFVVDEEEGKIWDMPDKQGGQQLTWQQSFLSNSTSTSSGGPQQQQLQQSVNRASPRAPRSNRSNGQANPMTSLNAIPMSSSTAIAPYQPGSNHSGRPNSNVAPLGHRQTSSMTWQQSLFPITSSSNTTNPGTSSPLAQPRSRRRNSCSTTPNASASLNGSSTFAINGRKQQTDPFSTSPSSMSHVVNHIMSTPVKMRQDAAAAIIRGDCTGSRASVTVAATVTGGGGGLEAAGAGPGAGGANGMGGIRYAGPTFHNSPMAETIPKPRFGAAK